MKKMSYEKMMELLEMCGHVLEPREVIVLTNTLTGHRTDGQLATFLGLPKLQIIQTRKRAIEKFRHECIEQMKTAGATEELTGEVMSLLSPV